MGDFAFKKSEKSQEYLADASMRMVRMPMNFPSLGNCAGIVQLLPSGWNGVANEFGKVRPMTLNAGPTDTIFGKTRRELASADISAYGYGEIRVRADIKKETAQAVVGKDNVLVTYVGWKGRVGGMFEGFGNETNHPYIWNELGKVQGIAKNEQGKDCLEILSKASGNSESLKPKIMLVPLEDITHMQAGYKPQK